MDKLLPCPFCGSEAKVTERNGKFVPCCYGDNDCIEFVRPFPCEKNAIMAWNTRAEEPNEPLTLDELKQMDGEPVWVAMWNNKAYQNKGKLGEKFKTHCFIRFTTTHFEIRTPQGNRFDRYKSDYGKSWLAYKHKPKEAD